MLVQFVCSWDAVQRWCWISHGVYSGLALPVEGDAVGLKNWVRVSIAAQPKQCLKMQFGGAALLFQATGEKQDGSLKAPPSAIPTGEKLKTNPDKGIPEDESNILNMKNVFGSNTYLQKKRRRFWRFLLDACRDATLIIHRLRI
ncbi:autoinhibited Ca2+ -ATPase, isoform 8 [Artemisia annua]|uniref:Autoinhibited Ca2+-ATPase, isoform 8 n=1 Tax=Artemisia annua TaxID=35608 RepID=A0A2U1KTI5_ARTAN|nr:autoinhibited Ca2+ -ATPase, isoform 8 [Artemisia annua]